MHLLTDAQMFLQTLVLKSKVECVEILYVKIQKYLINIVQFKLQTFSNTQQLQGYLVLHRTQCAGIARLH